MLNFTTICHCWYHAARKKKTELELELECVTQCLFWTRALKKKHFLWRSYRVKSNQNVVYRGLYSYRQWVRFITLFPNNFLYCFCNVERVCKSFWKESLTRILHNAARALSSRSRCFHLSILVASGDENVNCQLQQILTKVSFAVFNIVVKKTNRMRLNVVCILIGNETCHYSSQNLLWSHWFIHACRHKQNFHGNLNASLATFSTIFTSYLWRVSFRTLWRVWNSSEWHFLSLN